MSLSMITNLLFLNCQRVLIDLEFSECLAALEETNNNAPIRVKSRVAWRGLASFIISGMRLMAPARLGTRSSDLQLSPIQHFFHSMLFIY